MTQLKFDKKGFLIPQKINYDVKHDERNKEIIDKCKKTNKGVEINEIVQKIWKRVPKL